MAAKVLTQSPLSYGETPSMGPNLGHVFITVTLTDYEFTDDNGNTIGVQLYSVVGGTYVVDSLDGGSNISITLPANSFCPFLVTKIYATTAPVAYIIS